MQINNAAKVGGGIQVFVCVLFVVVLFLALFFGFGLFAWLVVVFFSF